MIQELLTSIKGFLDLSPEKRSTTYALLFCGLIIWYLYNQNQSLSDKLSKKETDFQIITNKLQMDCSEQLRVNNERDQKQISDFVIKTNNSTDSMNIYYRKELRKLNDKIGNQINRMKYEISN